MALSCLDAAKVVALLRMTRRRKRFLFPLKPRLRDDGIKIPLAV